MIKELRDTLPLFLCTLMLSVYLQTNYLYFKLRFVSQHALVPQFSENSAAVYLYYLVALGLCLLDSGPSLLCIIMIR